MGLDGVELVMAYEEAFGIHIPDAEAEKMTTPAKVINFIERTLKGTPVDVCLSQRAFYAIRSRLVEAGHARSAVTPAAQLEVLVPPHARRELWRYMRGNFSAVQWPELTLSRHHNAGIVAVCAALSAGAVWLLHHLHGVTVEQWFDSMLLALLVFVVAYVAALKLCEQSANSFPGLATVGDLARHAAGRGTGVVVRRGEIPSREQIAGIVRQMTLEQLGLNPAEYREHAEFVRDFGAD